MSEPLNQAAYLVMSAQSVIKDLIQQQNEITQAIARQQNMIDTLMPSAQWEEVVPPAEEPPIEEPPVEEEDNGGL